MTNNIEIIRVVLPGGRRIWAGVLNGYAFVANDDEKFAVLVDAMGFGILVETEDTVSLREFLDYASQHPILKMVPDWGEMMGLSTISYQTQIK